MSMQLTSAGAREDPICRFPGSALPVRGPCVDLVRPYLAFLGGSETFGRFVEAPFPTLVDRALGQSCVNLGSINAGLGAILRDAGVMRIAAGAELTVVQIPGAQDLGNQYYRVHPRRNDRFLAPTRRLAALYPEVDFTQFHFTKHLVTTLYRQSPARFAPVLDELRALWIDRMEQLLGTLGGRVLLLWLQYDDRRPQDDAPLGPDPLLVSRAMIDRIRPDARGLVEVPVVPAGRRVGETARMAFGPLQALAAEHLPGPSMHRRIAARLSEAIRTLD
ncbi:DUF6473 family protein [Antarcticimicrobium luteum]|uniref:DUF6473 domain-containing protein n=1 Tax=Antarcticimicrobium luteum TaxID=2547397 RepID=A0A4R5V4Q5_9RHOB|nr:DUF6473 family protein [Antarcticimicrobium luteum]TDK46721.1 hypothetical protein E1832_11495 [Antarcticimicrobium luteum]